MQTGHFDILMANFTTCVWLQIIASHELEEIIPKPSVTMAGLNPGFLPANPL